MQISGVWCHSVVFFFCVLIFLHVSLCPPRHFSFFHISFVFHWAKEGVVEGLYTKPPPVLIQYFCPGVSWPKQINVPLLRSFCCILVPSPTITLRIAGARAGRCNMFATLSIRPINAAKRLGRFYRAMSAKPSSRDLLINDSKYAWLKSLGLQEQNPGVFDGVSWHGSGPVSSPRDNIIPGSPNHLA